MKEIQIDQLRTSRDLSFYVKSVMSGKVAIKDVDLSRRIVTGFYNTYYYYDHSGDVLVDGAAKKSIQENGPASDGWHIKHALHHDLSKLPGKIITLDERKIENVTGIYFETKMSQSTIGNDTLINYQEGIYDNHSIGYRYINYDVIENDSAEWNKYLQMLINPEDAEKNGVMFIVNEIELFEGSTVAIGCNQLTPYLGVKSNNPELLKLRVFERINQLETQLRSGKQSDTMMRDFMIQVAQLKTYIAEIWPETTSTERPDTTKSEQNKDAMNWDKIIQVIQTQNENQ